MPPIFTPCAQIVAAGLVSAGLPSCLLLVVGKCRLTRQLAFVAFNSKNSNQLFIWRFVFGSFGSSICHS
jgi:hypothetical protein